jgi:hypothetical protein
VVIEELEAMMLTEVKARFSRKGILSLNIKIRNYRMMSRKK